MKTRTYNIMPMGKPRMTQRDKWAKRPCVMKYWEFKDECLKAGMTIPDKCWISFIIPMPDSWGERKRANHYMEPHQQKPDIDNLIKAVFDAVCPQDCVISEIHANKCWGEVGQIIVRGL